MAIKIDCPRCKRPLSVPSKLVGGYAACPHCSGRFWVSEDSDQSQAVAGSTVMPPEPPPAPQQPGSQQPQSKPKKQQSGSSVGTPPPPPPQPQSMPLPGSVPAPQRPTGGRKARFISAEAAQSKLDVAEDGKLPELHLHDVATKKKEKVAIEGESMNPLVKFGVIFVSLILSLLILMDNSDTPGLADQSDRDKAREAIETEYFGSIGGEEPLKPYEEILREAQKAHTRKDYRTERKMYMRVLDMLRAERNKNEMPVTGSPSRDKKLEEHIMTLLARD